MNDIDLNDPKLKTAAFILAEKTPRHLNVPTTPPIHWRLEGEILRVLLADGRTVRAPLADHDLPSKSAPKPVPVARSSETRVPEKVAPERKGPPLPFPKQPIPPPDPIEDPPVHKTSPTTPGRIK